MSSIRTRLLVGTMLAVLAVFGAVGIVVTRMTGISLRAEFDDSLAVHAESLAAQIDEDHGRLTSEIDPRSIDDNEAFEVWGNGAVLARSASLGTGDLVPATTNRAMSATSFGGLPARQITLLARARVENEPDEGPAATASAYGAPITIVFARTTNAVEETSIRIAGVMIGVGVAGLVVCVILILFVVQLGLRPIRTLASTIANIREADLSARVGKTPTATELLPITDRLDELLARLAAAFARERELTAEVAHELRTPLAGLRATMELALARERSAERYKVALEQALAITHQTERVVESLLSLARLDAGQASIDARPIDADQLVRDAIATIQLRAVERELHIVTELEPVMLTTDPDKLRVIVVNLLDNAVTYADVAGEIHIALTSANALRVMNTGCTLSPEQAAHAFDRFWRGDASRDQSAGHVGIGLALSKRLVELLGGTIEVVVRDGTFTATVQLP